MRWICSSIDAISQARHCKLGAVPASFFRSFVHKHRSMQHAAEYQYLHFATPELRGR